MPLHSLHEVPDIQREFLIIENGDKALVIKGGNYKEIENWLAGQLVHVSQHLRDGFVEVRWNLLADLSQFVEHPGQRLSFHNRNQVCFLVGES